MQQQTWTNFLEELGHLKYQELDEEYLKSKIKLPKEKMTFSEIQLYLSYEFKVHFNQNSTRSKWHWKDKYLLIWCVFKLGEKRKIEFNELYKNGVFAYIANVLEIPEQFLLEKWMSLLKYSLKENSWNPEEEKILIELRKYLSRLTNKYPYENWTQIAKRFTQITNKIRYQKQIRERYNNVTNPRINKNPWSTQEKQYIMLKAYQLKKNWAGISKTMAERTDNRIKNCYNTIVKKIAKKLHFDLAIPKQEQLILEYIQKYNTYDPDELANHLEMEQKNLGSIKVENVNETSNTTNSQNNIQSIFPSFQAMPILFNHNLNNQYQPRYIGYPVLVIKRDVSRQI